MELYKVYKEFLHLKVHYFLINAACAGVIPFIPVYAMQLGIKADVVGYIYAISCFISFLSRPIIGGIVDHFQKLKLVLVTLIIASIVGDLGLNFIPLPPQIERNSTTKDVFCFQNQTYIIDYNLWKCKNNTCAEDCFTTCKLCSSNSTLCSTRQDLLDDGNITRNISVDTYSGNFSVDTYSGCYTNISRTCSKETIALPEENCLHFLTESIPESNALLQVVMLSLLTCLIYIAYGSIVSLSDAACFDALGSHPEFYGKQRLWGTIGWGSFALLTGYLNQVFTGTSTYYNYSAGFYMLVVLFIVDMLVLIKFRIRKVKVSKKFWNNACYLIRKPRILLFVMHAFFVGIIIGFFRSYLFWYLRTLKASQLLLGSFSLVQTFLGELPFFFISGWIISKIGHMNTFTVSFVASAVRCLGYYFITNPWHGVVLELLQGPMFGSFYTALASYAKFIAPNGAEAMLQGIASGAFEGLGVATGSLLGGYCIEYFGERETFLIAAIFSFVCSFISFFVNNFVIQTNIN